MILSSNMGANILVLRAFEETRALFPAADFSNDPRVQTFNIAGNHGNIGGFYDNGIGALVLDGMSARQMNLGDSGFGNARHRWRCDSPSRFGTDQAMRVRTNFKWGHVA